MHTTFQSSIDTFVSAKNKGEGAFGKLADYCHAATKDNILSGMSGEAVADVLKGQIKVQEQEYRNQHPRMEEFPSAYRSAKSVILKALQHGVLLVDEKGKIKGKTALEKEINGMKEPKSEIAKFQSTIDTASKILDKIDNLGDVRQAKALVAILADLVLKSERSMMTIIEDVQKVA